MDNVVLIKTVSDARLLIEGCREDMKNEEKYSLQHYHTMWILKEIMLNPANSEEDRLAAAYLAYTSSSVRHSINFMLYKRKDTCSISSEALGRSSDVHDLMTELCQAMR